MLSQLVYIVRETYWWTDLSTKEDNSPKSVSSGSDSALNITEYPPVVSLALNIKLNIRFTIQKTELGLDAH